MRYQTWAECAVVVVIAFAITTWAQGPAPLHADSVRDFLFARDCVELDRCATWGASAVVAQARQGAVWVGVLSMWTWGGGSPAGVVWLVAALNALALGLVYGWMRVRMRHVSAALGVAVFLAAGMAFDGQAVLWNHSIVAPVAVAATLSIYATATSGRASAVAGAGLWTSLAAATHLASGLLYLPLAVGLGLGLSGPWIRRAVLVLLAGGAALLGWWPTSAAAVQANWDLLSNGQRLGGALGLLGLTGLGAWMRTWLEHRSVNARIVAVSLASLVFCATAIGVLMAFDQRVPALYCAPVFPALTVLAGLAAERAAERRSRILPWLLAVGGLLLVSLAAWQARSRSAQSGWSLATFGPVNQALDSPAHSYDELASRLRSPHAREALSGLALVAGMPVDASATASALLAIPLADLSNELDAAAVEADGFERVGTAGSATIVYDYEAWIDHSDGRVCTTDPQGRPDDCRDLGKPFFEKLTPEQFRHRARAHPRSHWLRVPSDRGLRFEFALASDPAGERVIRLLDFNAECPWQIVEVQGAHVLSPLPATHVRLQNHPGPGKIVIERGPHPPGPCQLSDGVAPGLWELSASADALLVESLGVDRP